jgi:hypothetical protein
MPAAEQSLKELRALILELRDNQDTLKSDPEARQQWNKRRQDLEARIHGMSAGERVWLESQIKLLIQELGDVTI